MKGIKRQNLIILLGLSGLLTACPEPDKTPPVVTLSASPATVTNPGNVTLTANVTDAGGVSRVEFFVDGALYETDSSAPFQVSRPFGYAENGPHAVSAKAYDNAGNTAEASASVTVAILDASEPNGSVSTARPLSIGGTFSGLIAGEGRDYDYLKFDAATGDTLQLTVKSVSVNAGSTLDPFVTILMPDGKTVLEQDDDSGAGLESDIRFIAPVSGTYYVVVTSFDIQDDPLASDDRPTNTYLVALSRL